MKRTGMVLVMGLPGSGKSYFATRLAARTGAFYVNSDEVRMRLVRDRSYTFTERVMVYNTMLDMVKKALVKEELVIVDATFFKNALRNKFINLPDSFHVQWHIIEIKAEEAVIRKRLGGKRELSEADFSVYRHLRDEFDPTEVPHLTLYSDRGDVEEMITTALSFLDEQKHVIA